MDRYATYSAKPHPTLSHLKRSLLYLSMAIKDEREAFYDSKTSYFGVVESLSITVKYHSFRTKTTCFTVIMVCDTLGRKVMLHHKPIVNELKAIMMLLQKSTFLCVQITIFYALGTTFSKNATAMSRTTTGRT